MNIRWILFATALIGSSAIADQFKTVKEDHSQKNNEFSIEYPVLFANSVPAYRLINHSLRKSLLDSKCQHTPDDINVPYNYDANLTIVALNDNYVGYEGFEDEYCGGAHPNSGSFYVVYDAQTGAVVDFDKEVPIQSLDGTYTSDQFDAYQGELARIIYEDLVATGFKADSNECISKTDAPADVLEQLKEFFPMITGYARDKQVVISIEPPHAAEACQFSIRVPFSKVEKYFATNAKAQTWLK